MKEYQKISNVFEFDTKHRAILGFAEPFKTLKYIEWEGTEKVDGTNIRIHWDGHRIEIGGRTDNAQFQGDLEKYLRDLFCTQEMEYVFEQMFGDKEVYLFGEGYGNKIQTNGELYSQTPKFILFDVNINGYDLFRNGVNDIAAQLGLDSVPIVFNGTLDEAKEFVSKHPMSTIGGHQHEMEGLVLVPRVIQLYDNKHNLIKCKCKYRDMLKGGLIKETIMEKKDND